MKLKWKQWLAALCAAVIALTMLPATGQNAAQAAARYGATTDGGVNVRQNAALNSTSLFQLPAGYVVEILGTSGEWYRVSVQNPKKSGDWRTGYIMQKFIRSLSWAEQLQYEDSLQNGGTSTIALGRLTSTVNVRQRPSINAAKLGSLSANTTVQLLTLPNRNDVDPWYKVSYQGMTGYVQGQYVSETSTGGLTRLPHINGGSIDLLSPKVVGYVKTVTNTYYRGEPAGARGSVIVKGTVLSCVGTTYANGSTWYAVLYGNYNDLVYIDAAFVEPCDSYGVSMDYLSTAGGTDTTQQQGYVQTTANKVYMRSNASSSASWVCQVTNVGTVLPYYGVRTVGSKTWYLVEAQGYRGWMVSDYARRYTMVSGTVLPPVTITLPGGGSSTVTSQPTQPSQTGAPGALGYVQTSTDKVYIRREAGTSKPVVTLLERQGTVLSYHGSTKVGSTLWYNVSTLDGVYNGWTMAKFLLSSSGPVTTQPTEPSVTTPAPSYPDGAQGYVRTTTDKVYIRVEPSTNAAYVLLVQSQGTILPYFGTTRRSGKTWYNVQSADGRMGWMHGDFVEPYFGPVTPDEPDNPEDPSDPDNTYACYVKTTIKNLYLRQGPSADYDPVDATPNQIETEGTVVPCLQTRQVGSIIWYYVKYGDILGWISGRYVEVTETPSPSDEPSGDEPTPKPETAKRVMAKSSTLSIYNSPSTSDFKEGRTVTAGTFYDYTEMQGAENLSWYKIVFGTETWWVNSNDVQLDESVVQTPAGYVITKNVGSGVRVRDGIGTTKTDTLTMVNDDGVIMPYYGTGKNGSTTWYNVRTPEGVTGWMSGNFLSLYTGSQQPETKLVMGQMLTAKEKVVVYGYPGTNAETLYTIPKKDVTLLYYTTTTIGTTMWYQVGVEKYVGWVQGKNLTQPTQPEPIAKMVKTGNVGSGINIRSAAAFEDNNRLMMLLDNNVVMLYSNTIERDGKRWYYVKTPEGVWGWLVEGSHMTEYKGDETPSYKSVLGTVTTTKDDVTLYDSPYAATRKSLAGLKIAKSTSLNYLEKRTEEKADWYQVSYDGRVGWVQASDVTVVSEPTNSPSQPTDPSKPTPSTNPYLGYLVTTVDNLFVREGAATNYKTIYTLEKGTRIPYTDMRNTTSGTWFKVLTPLGQAGWVLGYGSAGWNVKIESNTGDVDEPILGYVETTAKSVNLRASTSTSSQQLGQVKDIGTELPYYETKKVGSTTWYRVLVDGKLMGWMSGQFLKVTRTNPVVPTDPSTPTTPTTPVVPEGALGTVVTTADKVYIRSVAGGTDYKTVLGQVPYKGTSLPYYATQKVGSYMWYRVTTTAGVTGWMKGQFLTVYPSSGNTTQPSPSNTSTTPTDPTAAGTLHTTLTSVNIRATAQISGKVVTQIPKANTQMSYYQVTANQGYSWYYVRTPSGLYGWIRSDCVYVESGSGSTTTTGLYPAEMLDWSVVNNMWIAGQTYTVYDIYSQTRWNARRLYGSKHADVEPLTAADTAVICRMYGVSSASQINSTDHWQRRPSLVTIGNRTIACSLYGVPHGEQSITNNNFNGQCCLHFLNSTTHSGSSSGPDTNHQQAVRYAYEHCPAGQK